MSKRQYTNIAKINGFIGQEYTVTDQLIDQAESLVDSIVYNEAFPPLSKHYNITVYGEETFTTDGANSTVTISTGTYPTDYFRYCVVELLSDGAILPVVASVNSTLTVEGSVNGSQEFKVYQLGKFPRYMDTQTHNSVKTYKSIPADVQEAVAWQVKFIIDEGNKKDGVFDGEGIIRETIGENYSYEKGNTAGDTSSQSTLRLLAPRVKTLLKRYILQ